MFSPSIEDSYPEVQISIFRAFSHKIIQKIHEGGLDIGVVTMPVKDPRLTSERIFSDPIMLMTDNNHPLARRRSVALHEIIEYPIILPKTGQTRAAMDKLFRPYQSRMLVAMELPSIMMIKTFVASGMGCSLISESFALTEARAGNLRLIPLSDVQLTRELALVYRRDRTLHRSATAFVDLVLERTQALRNVPTAV